MKNKRDIYCEYAFWEAFFEIEEKVCRDRTKRKFWDAFYEFLSNNNLYFNIPIQNVKDETLGGANLMIIRQKKGGAGVKFIPKKFPKFENITDDDDNRLNSVFLTMLDSSECEALSERYGVIVLNISMIFSAEHVYIDNRESLDHANGQNWNYLFDFKAKCPSISYCNSLVIADRYLLANVSEGVLNANLKPILNAMLPNSLDNEIIFTICIIAENFGNSLGSKLNKIENLIKNLRPNLAFKLNIFSSKKLHDRSILTNNIMLTSGAGFDVIGENEVPLKFTTTSLCFPFLHTNINENNTYIDWINNVLKVERGCRSYQQNYWGEEVPRHHLLDYFYEEPVLPRATYSLGSNFGDLLSQIRATT